MVKFFEAKTKIEDPNQLGYLACSMAYQQAVEQALVAVASDLKFRKGEVRSRLREESEATRYDFNTFSVETALEHDFLRDAEGGVRIFAEELGLNEAEANHLVEEIHLRFPSNLNIILSHGKTRDRFAPFRDLIQLSTDSIRGWGWRAVCIQANTSQGTAGGPRMASGTVCKFQVGVPLWNYKGGPCR